MSKTTIYIILTAAIFATMEVAIKIAGAEIDAFQLAFLRFTAGGLVLLIPALYESKRSGYRLSLRDFLWMTSMGIMCIPISMTALHKGVQLCNASTAALLVCTNSVFTMLIAHIFTDEKMNKRKWLSLGLGLCAMVFIIRPWAIQDGNSVTGIVIMLFSAVTFGTYTVMGRRSIERIGAITQTSISFLSGSAIMLIIMLLLNKPVFEHAGENIGIILYCGIVVTGLGYLFYFLAIRYSDASTGSAAFMIKPVLAPLFATLILHEPISWNTIVAIVLLVTASYITISAGKRKT